MLEMWQPTIFFGGKPRNTRLKIQCQAWQYVINNCISIDFLSKFFPVSYLYLTGQCQRKSTRGFVANYEAIRRVNTSL